MSEPLVSISAHALTVGEIAALTGAELRAGSDPARHIDNIASLDRAGPGDVTFVDNSKRAAELAATRAGACLVGAGFETQVPARVVALRTAEPYRAFVAVACALFPTAHRPSSLFGATGVGAGATVHVAARLERDVTVDPGVVIGPGAEIGAGTVIAAHAVIGPGVRIGRHCSIGAGATLVHALLGDRVVIRAGCRIGEDGFGFLPDRNGPIRIPQTRRVIIQDDVEIGANSTVDRGGIRDTVIGEGTKIDNLVRIGHDCSIGRHCLIVAPSGILDGVEIQDYAMLGGRRDQVSGRPENDE